MNIEKITGAGIICYFDNTSNEIKDLTNDILFLVLEDYNGKYDFPKGCIDFGEYVYDCAVRETFEESNICEDDIAEFVVKDLENAYMCGKGLVLFLAKLKVKSFTNVKIKKNPHTEIYEHKNFYFLAKDEVEKNLPVYLNKSIEWAYNIIKNNNL